MPESLPHQEPDFRDASCRQMDVSVVHEYFFAERRDQAKRKMAKRICGGCVELQACREYALEIMPPVGVFGAMDEYDRYRISHGGAS